MAKTRKAKPLAITAMEVMTKEDFNFCLYRAMNKSDIVSFMEAYGATRKNAETNAYRKAKETEIIEVTNHLRKTLVEERVASASLTIEEILGFCARAIRTPLSEIDARDPLVVEVKETISPMGSVKRTFKKANPLDAAKVALTIMSNTPSGANTPISGMLAELVSGGIPEERDVTPINEQV